MERMGTEGFSEDMWEGGDKEAKEDGMEKSDAAAHLCGSLFFLCGPALSFWLAAISGFSVTCNHCDIQTKDKCLLSSLLLLMRKVLTLTSDAIFILFVTKVEQHLPSSPYFGKTVLISCMRYYFVMQQYCSSTMSCQMYCRNVEVARR